MLAHFPRIETALKTKSSNPETIIRYFKLCLSYIEFISPAEINLETGRIMRLLCQYPQGLKRDELLALFYEDYLTGSYNKQNRASRLRPTTSFLM